MKLILVFSLLITGCGGDSGSTVTQTLAVPDAISSPVCGEKTAYVSGESADFVSMVVPTAMSSGKSYAVSVTFCNNGTTTWNYRTSSSDGTAIGAIEHYFLSALNPEGNQTWGADRIELHPGDSVFPGHVKTFKFSVVAPLNITGVGLISNFQWGIVKETAGSLGISPNVQVTSFYTPVFIIQNSPTIPPVPVAPDDFNFENFQGANMIDQTYSQAGNNHRSWFPAVIQMDKIISQAAAMHLKYLRVPVIIPPDADSPEYVAAEWYTPPHGTGVNANNVNSVIDATKNVLDIALHNGLKVILVLDGYTEYDTECSSGAPGLKFWKKSFNSVKFNAASIVQAASRHPALYAWDILNEPMWNASAYGCLSVSPNSFDRGTQLPLISLAQASTATEESMLEVVEAVHAMYNLVRANDAYSHPTTVGEGQLPFLQYWNDISSFASPHLYLPPKAIIDAQVQANRAQNTLPQIMSFTGAPVDNSKWKLTDELLQTQIPMLAGATINAMKREATVNGAPLPFMIGEYGISYLDQVPAPEDQAVYYSLLGAMFKTLNTGSMLWDVSTGPQGGSNFSVLATDGSFLPAACVVAKNIASAPAGC